MSKFEYAKLADAVAAEIARSRIGARCPPSGMNNVSSTNAASPMTCVVQAGVCPGVCITKPSFRRSCTYRRP